ncbi:MAG: zeta toxin family protein [Deltaproteobacteria bacterium]|nr:zeta toxin family protein [Deltaproteobacteria bacterium]
MKTKIIKPRLIVIAGPNGSGKTTFTNQVLRHDWSKDCLFINPDEIAKNKFGDWNSPDAVNKAVLYAQELRENCLKERKSMLIETVFSAPEKLQFVQRVKEADFFIRFFFIGTDGPHINAARVTRRVMDGGHDVPIAKIISRYSRSIANSTMAMSFVDRAYGYDNSVDNRNPKKLFRTRGGQLFKTYSDLKLHDWGQMMIKELKVTMSQI